MILMDSVAVAVWPELSVTRTVKVKLPIFVGVPLIAPLVLRLRPVGSAPDAIVHVYGVVPFVACSVVDGYGTR